uniref:arabinan endo-1,5-alpha-L-arabinosidase n=1 Tax=Hyaloperonospora arabidopsidis (strain Emoy2) TaxID=559515 RepID=M4B9K9_HYAAE
MNCFRIAALVITLLKTATGATHVQPRPGACSGVCVNTHDPSIIRRDDGTYFRFSTGGGIAVHTADDLVGPWEYKGSVLPKGTKLKLTDHEMKPWKGAMDVWAPDVHFVDNTYYLYYSAVRNTSFDGHNMAAIGVATSPTMEIGTWKDLSGIGIQSNDNSKYNAIDPNLFEENGNLYMIFGSYETGLFQASMKNSPTAVIPDTYIKLAYQPKNHAIEGATMFKYGRFNYLFFSQGDCCGFDTKERSKIDEYKIKVCRSKPGVVDFRDKNNRRCTDGGGTVVFKSEGDVYGPGGQGVYDDEKYGPVLYYHYVNKTIGYADGQKQFGWNKLDFSSGWPVVKSS